MLGELQGTLQAGDVEIDALLEARTNHARHRLHSLLSRQSIELDTARIHLPHGTPSEKIHEVATDIEADLIVLGTVCRTGVAGFLIGNTAEQLLSRIDCSVLALKPEGFQTPIRIDDDDQVEWPEKFPMA